jgi:hypothetical protein
MSKSPKDEPDRPERTEYDRFADLARAVVAVRKNEVERLKAEREAAKHEGDEAMSKTKRPKRV